VLHFAYSSMTIHDLLFGLAVGIWFDGTRLITICLQHLIGLLRALARPYNHQEPFQGWRARFDNKFTFGSFFRSVLKRQIASSYGSAAVPNSSITNDAGWRQLFRLTLLYYIVIFDSTILPAPNLTQRFSTPIRYFKIVNFIAGHRIDFHTV
jgi:hypothetical protein